MDSTTGIEMELPQKNLKVVLCLLRNVSLKPPISTEVGELDSLVTKADLLGYALLKGIDVPEKHKSTGAIKKFLQGGYK